MLRTDKLSSHSVYVMVYIFSVLIRNSGEILVNSYGSDNKIRYLFSFVEFSSTMIVVAHVINFGIFLYGLGKIFITKKPTPILQMMQTIISPIHIWLSTQYLTLSSISSQSQIGVSISLWGIINLIVASLILVITPKVINEKFNFYQLKTNNNVNALYDVLLGIDFVVQAVGPQVGVNGDGIVWGVAFIKLLRVVVYFTKINYADPMVEYCALLGEMTSGVGLVSTFLNLYYNLNTTPLIWINTIFIIYFSYYKNSILTELLQYKYHVTLQSLKQSIIEQINSGQNNSNLLSQQKILEMIIIFVGIINHDSFESEPWLRVRFSPKFVNQAIILRQLIQYSQSQQGANHSKKENIIDPTQSSINSGNIYKVNNSNDNNNNNKNSNNNNNNNSNDRIFHILQTNVQHQWSTLWKMIEGLREVKQQGYSEVRNYLIYTFPKYDMGSINRLIYLYYLNTFISTDDNANRKPSFWSKISQPIVYKYLTDRVFSQYCLEINKETSFQSDKTKMLDHFDQKNASTLKNYPTCDFFIYKITKGKKKLQTSKFDLFYRQLLTQDLLQNLFTKIFSVSKRILQLTNQPERNSNVLQLLLKKSTLRKEIKQKLQGIQNLSKLKSITYKFLLEYYVNNTPHIAINNLRERNFQEYLMNGQKDDPLQNLIKKKSAKQKQIESTNNGRMIVFVSGIQKLGRIVNYCGNFKHNMELSSAFGKLQQESLQHISVSDIMLPLWTKQHSRIAKSSKKYDIKSHSNKKLFIQSLVSKHVFEISFQLHYIVRNMKDLIFSLQMTFIQVDKLLIYKGSHMIFESFRRIHEQQAMGNINRMKRRRSFLVKDKKNNLNEFTKSVERYFGEQCAVYVQYSKARKNWLKQRRDSPIKKKKIQKVPTIQERCISGNEDIINKHVQMIQITLPSLKKGQKKVYRKNTPSQKQQKMNPQSLASFFNGSSPNINKNSYISTAHSSNESIGKHDVRKDENNPQKNQHKKKLLRQIKLKQYGKENLFHKTKLWMFTTIHWQIPPIILVVCFVIRWYSMMESDRNNSTYGVKLLLENQFMVTQTQLMNDLMYINQFAINYGQFNASVADGNVEMVELMLDDVRDAMGVIDGRQLALHDKLNNAIDGYLVDIIFDPVSQSDSSLSNITSTNINDTSTLLSLSQAGNSFYFTTLLYEILARQYIFQIGITQILQSNTSITLSMINKVLTLISNLNNNATSTNSNFFHTFQNRYQNYVISTNNNTAILEQIKLYEKSIYTFSQTFLTYFLVTIAVISFITSVLFVYIYVDLQFSVQKLVLEAITFPREQFKKIKNTLSDAKLILQNAKQYIPTRIISFYDNYQNNPFVWSPKTQMFSKNETPSSSNFPSHNSITKNNTGVKMGLYDMKYKVYKSKWEVFKVYLGPILVFCIIVGICQFLLISFISSTINETQTISRFSSGTQQLTKITAMSHQISIQMSLGIQQMNKTSIQEFLEGVSQYAKVDKLELLKPIELTENSYREHTFDPICNMFLNEETPMQCKSSSKELSFQQCMSANLKQFKFIGTYLTNPPSQQSQFILLNSQLQQIHSQLSLINLFTSKIIDFNIQNYQKVMSEPVVYLQLLIAQMGVLILLLNWYTMSRLYNKMRMLYDEMFYSCTVEEMLKIEHYKLFINQSKDQKINYVSGEYVDAD